MYITLVSNSELYSRHPQNTASHFLNTLSSEIVLEHDYEVGIKRLIYENNFKTIVDESITYEWGKLRSHRIYIQDNITIVNQQYVIEGRHFRYTFIDGYWVPNLVNINPDMILYSTNWESKKHLTISTKYLNCPIIDNEYVVGV